jgi:hypothetical protein
MDTVDMRINSLLADYMKERNPEISDDLIDASIERVKVIKAIIRQACIDVLEGEIETMVARNAWAGMENEPLSVPVAFISGNMHARDVLSGGLFMSDYEIQ